MSLPDNKYCPGTLAEGYNTYSRTCLNRVFSGKLVNHLLPYNSPSLNTEADELFDPSRNRISISGVQEKYSVLLEKNKLRLINEGERGCISSNLSQEMEKTLPKCRPTNT